MSKKRRWETTVLGKDGQLKTKMLSKKGLIKEARRSRERSSPAFEKWVERERSLASSRPGVDAAITLAQYAPAGVAHAGTVDWNPPDSDAFRQPPGLDAAGVALHGLIADRARRTGEPYFEAMARVTGIPDYRGLSDLPTTPVRQQGLDPERMAIDNAARALAASAGISWLDACSYLMEPAGDLGDGSAAVPWLDSRPVSPPRPWSDDDWQRDKRRARAAGIQVGADGPDGEDNQLKSVWLAAAEQGHDIVGEMAEQQRADAIATREARREGLLDQARAAEDNRRSGAINDELTRRARNRVAAPGRAAARRLPGTSQFPA